MKRDSFRQARTTKIFLSEEFRSRKESRIKRGLYRTKDKKLVNSDINASANIGRKSKADLFEKREVLEAQMARSNTILYRVKNPQL